jgi:type 1 glutamine amidotransferase
MIGALVLATSMIADDGRALVVPNPRVLVFSRTTGFRHDCIPVATKEIWKLGVEAGFTVDDTEDPSWFTPERLEKYDVVMFLCTTGDVLNDAQQNAFEQFISKGGGYVGVHSAADTEYQWPTYKNIVGAYFKSHPAIQKARVIVEDKAHPSTAYAPKNWWRTDEWYDYTDNPRGRVRVLASLDTTSYKNSTMGSDHPIVWTSSFGQGRTWYTGFGHTKESYTEPLFRKMLAEAVIWTAQSKRPANAVDVDLQIPKAWVQANGELDNKDGRSGHLVSKSEMADGHYHAEFKIPAGSNSGVYIMGRYEIQIFDSFGKADKDLTFADAGGVYQRWQNEKGFEGKGALVNALRKPGEWNTYDIRFQGPRFKGGKKVSNAKFLEVRLNGVVVQRNEEVTGPTRAPMFEDEKPTGPLMLQGDHGPITYRNVWFAPK